MSDPSLDEPRPPLLSVCMILRDEAERLPAALRSLSGLADEVVVVDTGSQDGTATLARELGCRVVEQPWEDDFSLARNRSLEEARGEWVLWMDADEVAASAPGQDLRAALRGATGCDLGFVRLVSPDSSGGREEALLLRAFRRSRGFRFRYPVHEQLDARDAKGLELPLALLHLGVLEEDAARARQEGYLRLLERLPARDPHRIVFSLRGLSTLGRWAEVERWAEAAWETLPPDHEELPRLLYFAAVAAFNRDERAATARWLRRGLERFPEHPDLHFVAAAQGAWMAKVHHAACRDPAHPLFGRVGESARFLPPLSEFLAALGLGGSP